MTADFDSSIAHLRRLVATRAPTPRTDWSEILSAASTGYLVCVAMLPGASHARFVGSALLAAGSRDVCCVGTGVVGFGWPLGKDAAGSGKRTWSRDQHLLGGKY
jgi:hypothetical protein